MTDSIFHIPTNQIHPTFAKLGEIVGKHAIETAKAFSIPTYTIDSIKTRNYAMLMEHGFEELANSHHIQRKLSAKYNENLAEIIKSMSNKLDIEKERNGISTEDYEEAVAIYEELKGVDEDSDDFKEAVETIETYEAEEIDHENS